jgi:hypothetical protein
MIIKTPCMTNFMAFTFNQSFDYKNSFMTRCLMDVNYKVVKPKNPIVFAHTTSLLTTQRWNLSIWLNINLSPPDKLTIFVTTLALGSQPRQGHGKVRTKSVTWESHSHSQSVRKCEGMNTHIFKWTPTLGIRILMKSRIFKERFERSKLIRFGLWWILWIRVCPWFVCAPKMLQLCINQLVSFVQVHMNNWPTCHSS